MTLRSRVLESILRRRICSILHKTAQQDLMTPHSAMLMLRYTLVKAPPGNLLGHLKELKELFQSAQQGWLCKARTPDSEVPAWKKLTESRKAERMLYASCPRRNHNLCKPTV